MRRLWLVLLCIAAPALAGPKTLPTATDLRSEAARAAAQGQPLLILYSRQDCRYCATVRRDYLIPLQAGGKGPLIRQIDQDSDAPLLDFAGERSSHSAFAAARKVRTVPMVAFYGPRGEPLAEPIVGLRLADFYSAYLDDALAEARTRLRR